MLNERQSNNWAELDDVINLSFSGKIGFLVEKDLISMGLYSPLKKLIDSVMMVVLIWVCGQT
jgi:hypothetical protein